MIEVELKDEIEEITLIVKGHGTTKQYGTFVCNAVSYMLGTLCILFEKNLVRKNKLMVKGGTDEDTLLKFNTLHGEINLFVHTCLLLQKTHPEDIKVDVSSGIFKEGMSA